ncbi:hypothetical protein JDN41_01615 [Rhodomicrobium udaipurense]|uniref:Uncharacterized protein n=1 Tax=Rhodomicrobium udaipurense TaxID=1202716 RepID=A0A8I1G809_9HYPH|nr:hypothetical protein [Rhodomicrobium udaipurense]
MAEAVGEILRRGGDDDGAERIGAVIEALEAEAEYLTRLSAATPIGGRA